MKLSEFVPSPGSRVRVPASAAAPAGYLDGVEQALLDALEATADRSVGSLELAQHVTDWPTLYHLTPYRTTVFDSLGFHGARDASVLELGAGCGAITRWLGEHFGSVSAIEGSVERASVAAARCADLDGVQLYSANYSLLQERDAFDVATLIGVLEYGHIYHPGTRDPDAAAADNLRVAFEALRDDSVLLLAIENRLGLKYLNGAMEDHSGRAYDSIQGYPRTDGAVTWSRRELERMVRAAGFSHVDTLLPFPDYKLTSTVIDPAVAQDDDIANWLLGTAPDRGADGVRSPSYSETLAQREAIKGGLLADLSNSLFLIAYKGDAARATERLGLERGWGARHYSLDRRSACRKRVTLTGAGEIVNEPAIGSPRDEDVVELGLFEHRLAPEPRVRGGLLIFDVLQTLAIEGVGQGLVGHVLRHAVWLQDTFGTGAHDEAGMPLVDGAAIDALWINIVADAQTGAWHAIDKEWRFRGALPLDYVVWRNLAMLQWRFPTDLPADWRELPGEEVAFRVAGAAGLISDPSRLELMRELEAAFQAAAAPGTAPVPSERVQALSTGDEDRFCVLARADEVVAHPELLRAYASAFGATDRATLLLFAEGADAESVVPRLRGAIAAAEIDEDTMPDAVVVETGEAQFGAAVLTAAAWGPVDLPRFAAGEIGALRALAERSWASAA